EIFHPSFREFVRVVLAEAGTDVVYHARLGRVAAERGNAVGAAVHLLRAGDEAALNHLLPGAEAACMGGAWTLSLELAQAAMDAEWEDDPERAGHASFLR